MVEDFLSYLAERNVVSESAKISKRLSSQTNQCYLIDDPKTNSKKVVKLLRKDALAVTPYQLITNSSQAAALGMTPPFEHIDTDRGIIVMPYRKAETLADSAWSVGDKIAFVADLCVQVHHSALDFPPMELAEELRQHITQVKDTAMRTTFNNRMGKLPKLPHVERLMPEALRPAHLDLSFANILSNGEILDWEYARQTLPIVDLAFCATINQLNEQQAQILFDCYSQKQRHEASFLDFKVYCAWSELLNCVWYYRAKTSALE